MVRIALYIFGSAGALLVLGIAASANLLAIAAALVLWAGCAYCMVSAWERINRARLRPQLRRVILMCASWPISGLYVANRVARERIPHVRDRLIEQFRVACLIVLGSLLFLLGIWTLSTTLSGGQVAALLFGPAFLAGAWVVSRRYAQLYQAWRSAAPPGRIVEPGHADEMMMYWAAIMLLAAVGILILVVAL